MQNESRMSKAEMVRVYVSQNRKATPRDVINALASSGVKITPSQVYTLMSKGRRRKVAPPPPQKANGYESLVQAKKMADAMGGVDKAIAALNTLAKILD